MQKFALFLVICTLSFSINAQLEKKIPDDPYGIGYDDVFENMHYNQPLRPQVHYTPITGQIGDATGLILLQNPSH